MPRSVIKHSTLNIQHSSEIEPPGAVAQLGEHLLCKQGVVGSIPISSTIGLVRDPEPQHTKPRGSAVNSIGRIEFSVDLRDQSVP